MKAATLRRFLSVHTWMGLIAGMALFIAFYAGAITVFSHELNGWQVSRAAAVADEQSETPAAKPAQPGFMDKLNERWDKRQEGDH